MNVQGFTPAFGGTLVYTTSGASQNQVLTIGAAMQEIMVQNVGTATVFFRWGTTAQTAITNTDCPVLPGAIMIFTIGLANNVAVIGAAGSVVYVTPGEGH